MDKSENINELADALAKAQASIKNPQRNREVKVATRTGGSYKFKYATLDSIIDGVRPHLTKNGLWFVQSTEIIEARTCLSTTLIHSSGQWIKSTVPLSITNTNQELGSELTYKRRYSLTALLGLAADEDEDGNIADGNIVKQATDAPEAPTPHPALQPAEATRVKEMLQTTEVEIAKQLSADGKLVRAFLKDKLVALFGTNKPKELTILQAGEAIQATWDYYRAQTQPSRESMEA